PVGFPQRHRHARWGPRRMPQAAAVSSVTVDLFDACGKQGAAPRRISSAAKNPRPLKCLRRRSSGAAAFGT
ncbi:MAG: hypothetical protein WAM91_18245, partial [Candidatus Acidiferrales bacterium]